MTNTQASTGNTAVFIDLENLFRGDAKDVASVPLSGLASELKNLLHRRGRTRITAFRAYANWARPAMMAYQKDLMAHGIEAIQIFSHSRNIKNAADIQLVVDALAEAQDRPATDTFVIVTGDGGFVPLARRLRQLDKHVIVASTDHPEAGAVSELLHSAADEYHQLAVTRGAPEPSAVVRRPQPSVPQKSAPRKPAPTLEEYRDEVKALVKRKPELLIEGAVNGSPVGIHLRSKWPGVDYTAFGSPSLGEFVERHCGLPFHRPKSDSAGPKEYYARAVRAALAKGPLAEQLKAGERVYFANLGSALCTSLPGLTFKEAGHSKLISAVTDALEGTPWRVEKMGAAVVVVARP